MTTKPDQKKCVAREIDDGGEARNHVDTASLVNICAQLIVHRETFRQQDCRLAHDSQRKSLKVDDGYKQKLYEVFLDLLSLGYVTPSNPNCKRAHSLKWVATEKFCRLVESVISTEVKES
jgi:hypothetical protein